MSSEYIPDLRADTRDTWQANEERRVVNGGVRKIRVSRKKEERKTKADKNGRSRWYEKRPERVEKKNGEAKVVREWKVARGR